MQKDSGKDIGRFSAKNRKGMVRIKHVQAEWTKGMMLLNTCCSTSAKADIPRSVEPVLWNEELWKAKEVENCLYTFVVIHKLLKWFFSHYYFRQSAQCLQSSSGYVRRTGLEDFWPFSKHGETCCSRQIRDQGCTNRFVDHDQPTCDQWASAGRPSWRLSPDDSISWLETKRNWQNQVVHVGMTHFTFVNGRRTRRVRPKLFGSFEEDDQIASTWSLCTSKRRWSSWLQNLGTDVSFRICVFSAIGPFEHVWIVLQTGGGPEKTLPVLCLDPFQCFETSSLGHSGGKRIDPALQGDV